MSGQPCEHKGRLVGLIPQTKYLRIRSVPVVYVLREDYCSLGKCSKGLFSLARRFSIEYEKIIIASPVTRTARLSSWGIVRSSVTYI